MKLKLIVAIVLLSSLWERQPKTPGSHRKHRGQQIDAYFPADFS